MGNGTCICSAHARIPSYVHCRTLGARWKRHYGGLKRVNLEVDYLTQSFWWTTGIEKDIWERRIPTYRPKRSWGKVIFSLASVILFTGGGSTSVHAGIPHPTGTRHPPNQAPPWLGTFRRPGTPPRPGRHPPGPGRHPTPGWGRHPPDQAGTPPGPSRHPPTTQRRAYWEIRSTSGWYASYWNAILFKTYKNTRLHSSRMRTAHM